MKKKSHELRNLTLSMGFVSAMLSAFILHSLFDIKAVAKDTISRIPASLAVGIVAEPQVKKLPQMAKLDLDCRHLSENQRLQLESQYVQFQFSNCTKNKPIELINLTNGFQATFFRSPKGPLSDLVALNEGENEIHLRVEKNPSPFSLLINLNK